MRDGAGEVQKTPFSHLCSHLVPSMSKQPRWEEEYMRREEKNGKLQKYDK